MARVSLLPKQLFSQVTCPWRLVSSEPESKRFGPHWLQPRGSEFHPLTSGSSHMLSGSKWYARQKVLLLVTFKGWFPWLRPLPGKWIRWDGKKGFPCRPIPARRNQEEWPFGCFVIRETWPYKRCGVAKFCVCFLLPKWGPQTKTTPYYHQQPPEAPPSEILVIATQELFAATSGKWTIPSASLTKVSIEQKVVNC